MNFQRNLKEQDFQFLYFQKLKVQILGIILASPLLRVMLHHQDCEEFHFIRDVVNSVRTINDNCIALRHQVASFIQILLRILIQLHLLRIQMP